MTTTSKPSAWLFLPLALVLGGCSAYLEPAGYRALIDSDEVTVDRSPASFAYRPSALNTWQTLELGGARRVFDFGSGPTLYEALAIPPEAATTRVDALFSGYAQADEHVTYPTLLFLDDNHGEVVRVTSDMVQGAAGNGATLFRHDMQIPRTARYLVLFVDPQSAPGSVQWRYGGFSGGGGFDGVGARQVAAEVGLGGPVRVRFDSADE